MKHALTTALLIATYTQAQDPAPENLALGKSYTLTKPNYRHCTDPGDATQLTDGVYTGGYFWTQKTTVGWTGGATRFITIDLGKEEPISGASFGAAAGRADVEWPSDLWVFVSSDRSAWHFAGDLLDLSAEISLPPKEGYGTHVFRTTRLRAYGRYVQIVAAPGGPYLFVDEIEVYRGQQEWLREPRRSEPVLSVEDYIATQRFNALIKAQLRRDLDAVRQSIESARTKAEFEQQLERLSQHITKMPTVPREGFRAVLPMTDLEREIFRLHAAVWRAQDKPKLRVWKNHRWDPLAPSQEPKGTAPEPVLDVHMMSNEFRADVLNLTNAGGRDVTVRVRIEGLPGGTNPDYVHVHEVLTVGTRRFVAVSAALPLARKDGDEYVVSVPSGMTRQIWLSFHPRRVAPGRYDGRVVLSDTSGKTRSVECRLKLYPLKFPDSTTLLLGGWAYTDADQCRGVTATNRDALIAHLREHFVNAPWATPGSMPLGKYDDEGNLVDEPDTQQFDAWVKRWSDAKCYMVYNAFGDWGNISDSFVGSKAGTEQFARKVANWIRFWAQHLRDLGLSPGKLGLLLVDEPHSDEHYRVLTAYAKAINATEPDVILWVDVQPKDAQACLDMMAQMDVLVPYRKMWLRGKDWFHQLFLDQRAQGRELGFYSCDGPARRFDPFSYYLLQQWHTFAIGGRWACFWSFGDNSKADPWNEYASDGRGPYSPVYLAPASVTSAKYMEAVREGVQDYEYLVMLRDRLAAKKAAGAANPAIKRAEELLATACERVLAGEKGDNYTWDQDKDRSIADTVRIEVLETLAALRKQ